jgi:hypothetical protein
MKLLKQYDYNKLFLSAVQYDTNEKITAYFKGRYNEVKEFNSLVLFINGIYKAYSYYSSQFREIYVKKLNEYHLMCNEFPGKEYEEPDINDCGLFYLEAYLEDGIAVHYHHYDIERIKQGFDEFVKQVKAIEEQSAYKKPMEKNKPPKKFNCTLNLEQIEILANYINEAHLFCNSINKETLQAVFDCTLKEPLSVNNNRLLAYFFDQLKATGRVVDGKKQYMVDNEKWQSVAEENKLFLSENGKLIKAIDLSSALSQIKAYGNPKGYDKIDDGIKAI